MNFIASIFIFNHQWVFFVRLFLILFLNSFFPLQYSASKASQVVKHWQEQKIMEAFVWLKCEHIIKL